MNSSDKLLISKAEDLFSLCEKYASPRFSDFLDGAEEAVIRTNVVFPYDYNVMFFGGFDDAEKKIMGVFPSWEEPQTAEFPIKCLRIDCPKGGNLRKLNHRDYLGTIMSLGITTGVLGDIVVCDGFAYVLLKSDMAEYVADNLHKIGNQGVKVSVIDDLTQVKIERKYKTFGTVCAAPRLDAIVGAAANISRSQASALIGAGKVKLNHRETDKSAETVKEGDLLSIRGYGRFLVHSFDGETRKMRMHVTLKQYI